MRDPLTRWTVVFADPRQEGAFRASTRAAEQATMRAAAAVVFVVDVLTMALDKLVYQHPLTASELTVQISVLLVVASVYFLLGWERLNRSSVFATWSSLLLGLGIALLIAFGDDMAYRGGLMIPPGILICYLVFRYDLRTLTLLAAAYTVFTVTGWMHAEPAPQSSEIIFLLMLAAISHALGFVESRRAQSERRTMFAQQQTLARMARRDDLTSLHNRRHFCDAVDEYLRGPIDEQHEAAIMLVDLDRFKEINDSLGHHSGDVVLRKIAARLRHALPQARVLARLGGDEFGALLVGKADGSVLAQARQLLAKLDEPIEIDGLSLQVYASIGLSPRRPGEDRQSLMQHADIAMYRAKRRGGGIEIFDDVPDDALVARKRANLEPANEQVSEQAVAPHM